MVSDNDQCPIYKTRKKRICFVSRLNKTLVLWNSKNFMKIGLTSFWVDRMDLPFFGLTEWVDLSMGSPNKFLLTILLRIFEF